MNKTIPFLLAIAMMLSCNTQTTEGSIDGADANQGQTAFDKTKWSVKAGPDYPYRDQMLHDVVYNDTVRTLNKTELLELFGEPDRSNKGHLYYMISQKRLGSWVLHSRFMVIKLQEDDTVDWIKIHE